MIKRHQPLWLTRQELAQRSRIPTKNARRAGGERDRPAVLQERQACAVSARRCAAVGGRTYDRAG